MRPYLIVVTRTIQEGLYDSENKPRLNYARIYFLEFSLDKDIDFKELEKFYNDWVKYDEYLVLQKQSDNLQLEGEIYARDAKIL